MIKNKELMLIGVTIFLTVLSWLIIDIREIAKETPTESQIESIDLNYSIDTKILDELSTKKP